MTPSLPRLFVTTPLEAGAGIEPNPGQSHYLLHVLRLQDGAQILVFDGRNGEWIANVAWTKRGCKLNAVEKVRDQTSSQDLGYLFAPLKQARLDYMVQKAVEMGVSQLQPVITARTVVPRLAMRRLEANAIEAAEQCGILTLPRLEAPVKLPALLKTWSKERRLIFCDEKAGAKSPLSDLEGLAGRRIAVLIGPEGGFSGEERETLLAQDFVLPISLGPRIMRADTAAVAALALVNAVLGDWA